MRINQLFILVIFSLTIGACSMFTPPNGIGGIQPPPRIDFASAAQKLGVTETQLKSALGVPEKPPIQPLSAPPPRPDIKGAATKLGVTESKLIEALGIPPHPPGDPSSTPR